MPPVKLLPVRAASVHRRVQVFTEKEATAAGRILVMDVGFLFLWILDYRLLLVQIGKDGPLSLIFFCY